MLRFISTSKQIGYRQGQNDSGERHKYKLWCSK